MNVHKREITGVAVAIFIVLICCTPQFRSIYSVPYTIEITEGNGHCLGLSLPIAIDVKADQENALRVNGYEITRRGRKLRAPFTLEPLNVGQVNLEFRLFGFLPIRKVAINVVPRLELIPGGHSIGVTLKTEGVLVVGHAKVVSSGKDTFPSKEAGIEIGDHIVEIDGKEIRSVDDIERVMKRVTDPNKELNVILHRVEEVINVKCTPAMCDHSKKLRLGVYVKDSAAGVGTLTFVDPETKTFGALGHIVTDVDTNRPLNVGDGDIVKARVTSVELGKPGCPGQKHSVSINGFCIIGKVEKNSPFGIFGHVYGSEFQSLEAIPIALMDQVKEGPAEIWTVVEDENVERFSVRITRATKQYSPSGKGMIIEIDDERLLRKTGGIVQGMSGSPIIQEGRLVGAVTHVFLNNPARGYGCYIEFMILESGMIDKQCRHLPTILWPLRRVG